MVTERTQSDRERELQSTLSSRWPQWGDLTPADGGRRHWFAPMVMDDRQPFCLVALQRYGREATAPALACPAVIDSGAQQTTVTAAVADQLGLQMARSQELVGIAGMEVRAYESKECCVSVAGVTMVGPLWVVQEMPAGGDVLLGADYILATGMSFEPAQGVVRFPAHKVHTVAREVACATPDQGVRPVAQPVQPLRLQGAAQSPASVGGSQELRGTALLNQPRQLAFEVMGDEGATEYADGIVEEDDFEDMFPSNTTISPQEFAEQVDQQTAHVDDPVVRDRLRGILHAYRAVFMRDLSAGGTAKVEPIDIAVPAEKRATPIRAGQYRLKPDQAAEVHRIVQDMLAQGVIKPAYSPWNNPVLLAPKKGGEWRFCVDLRRLNAITDDVRRNMTLIHDVLERVAGNQYYSSVDFRWGYWQVGLREEDQPLTAFTVDQQYVYVRAPFGLKNCPAQFAMRVHEIVERDMPKEVSDFFDDLILATCKLLGAMGHLDRLEMMLAVLAKYNIKLNIKKVHLLREEIVALGHVVSATGTRTDPAKVAAVLRMPAPTDVKGVQRFLGMCGFYGWMMEDMSRTAAPLHDLTHIGAEWKWGVAQERAFQSLKQKLVDVCDMVAPDPEAEIVLVTDASADGFAAVLAQRGSDGRERPIRFFSRRTTPTQRKWSATHLECGAVVLAFREFGAYLSHGRPFVVVTDHQALQSVLHSKDPKGRIARWLATLVQYNFRVEYRPGKQNVVADALSRCFQAPSMRETAAQTEGLQLARTMLGDARQPACTVASVATQTDVTSSGGERVRTTATAPPTSAVLMARARADTRREDVDVRQLWLGEAVRHEAPMCPRLPWHEAKRGATEHGLGRGPAEHGLCPEVVEHGLDPGAVCEHGLHRDGGADPPGVQECGGDERSGGIATAGTLDQPSGTGHPTGVRGDITYNGDNTGGTSAAAMVVDRSCGDAGGVVAPLAAEQSAGRAAGAQIPATSPTSCVKDHEGAVGQRVEVVSRAGTAGQGRLPCTPLTHLLTPGQRGTGEVEAGNSILENASAGKLGPWTTIPEATGTDISYSAGAVAVTGRTGAEGATEPGFVLVGTRSSTGAPMRRTTRTGARDGAEDDATESVAESGRTRGKRATRPQEDGAQDEPGGEPVAAKPRARKAAAGAAVGPPPKKTRAMGVAVPPKAAQTALEAAPAAAAREEAAPGKRTVGELVNKVYDNDPWRDEALCTTLFVGALPAGATDVDRARVARRQKVFKLRGGKMWYLRPGGGQAGELDAEGDPSAARDRWLPGEAWVPRPDERVGLILERHAEAAHEGATLLTQRLLQEGLWWPALGELVEAVVARCAVCLRANPMLRPIHDPARATLALTPLQRWAIDLLDLPPTALGNQGLCVIVDLLTRYPFAGPIRSKSAAEAARVLGEAVSLFGSPAELLSDNGSEFIALPFEQLCRQWRIRHTTTAPANPRSNGAVERTNRLIVEALRRVVEGNPTNWERDLPVVLHALRSRRSGVTGFSPFRLMFGREVSVAGAWDSEEPPLTTQVDEVMAQVDRLAQLWTVTLPMARRNQQRAKAKQMSGQDRRWLVGGPLMPGQVVYRRAPRVGTKLSNPYSGPYRVAARRKGGDGYTLETASGVRVDATVPRHELKAVSSWEALPQEEPDDAEPFEEVLGARPHNGEWQYMVRWCDREPGDPDRDEWVSEANFANAEAMHRFRVLAPLDVTVEDEVVDAGAAAAAAAAE